MALSGGAVTRLGAGWSRNSSFILGRCKRFFCSSKNTELLWPPCIQLILWALSQGV